MVQTTPLYLSVVLTSSLSFCFRGTGVKQGWQIMPPRIVSLYLVRKRAYRLIIYLSPSILSSIDKTLRGVYNMNYGRYRKERRLVMNQQDAKKVLSCPVCGNKRRPDSLVCSSCYQVYRTEASDRLLRGESVDPLSWVHEKVDSLLQGMRAEAEDLTQKIDELSEANRADATAFVNEMLETAKEQARQKMPGVEPRPLPQEVINGAIKKKRDELWQAKGGNKMWRRREELRQKIEQVEASLLEGATTGQSSEAEPDPDPVPEDPAVARVVEAALAASGSK